MTAPKRERFANNAFSTLNGGIDASQTTIDVIDGSSFPPDGNFRLTISDEILLCTARSGGTLTVVRGVEGTTPATHGDGSNIVHTLTAGGLTRFAQDNDPLWGYPGRPALGRLTDASGNVLTVSDFTWVNQGGATAVDENGTIIMDAPPASGENIRILLRPAPSPPWAVTIAFQHCGLCETVNDLELLARESSTGRIVKASFGCDSNSPTCIAGHMMNSPTSYHDDILLRTKLLLIGRYTWMKLTDNGTNLILSVSMDGIEWDQIWSVARAAWLTSGANQYGWGINNYNSSLYHQLMRLVHWSES